MLKKKDNLIIFVLALLVMSLAVFIMTKDIDLNKNKNISINKNLNLNINNNINENQNTNNNLNSNINQSQNKDQTPENFVKEFYDYYFGPHYPVGISNFEFIKNGNYLSDSFLKRIEGDKFRSYLLTCDQKKPISREYDNIIMAGWSAKVLAHHFYTQKDNQIVIILNSKNDKWEIEDIQCSDNNQIITDKIDTSDWLTYNDEIAGFSFKYPIDILWGDMSTNILSDRLVLNVDVSSVNSFPLNAPSGYNKKTILEDKKFLKKGEYGNKMNWSIDISQNVIKISRDKYGKSFVVFGRWEDCDVTFEKILFFYHNDYRIGITLYGSIKDIVSSMPEYFENRDWCGEFGESIVWKLHDNNKNQFYKSLKNNSASMFAQNWYDTFDEIVKTIEIK